MAKKKSTPEPEKKVTRRPRRTLAERAVEGYTVAKARMDRTAAAQDKAEAAMKAAQIAHREAVDEVLFWEHHPAVERMLEDQQEADDQAQREPEEDEES